MEVDGPYALPYRQEHEEEEGWNEPPIGPDWASTIAPTYFNTRKVSIYGGSNEIQKNIIAKAILGLKKPHPPHPEEPIDLGFPRDRQLLGKSEISDFPGG